jgi:hypothetical protein
LVRNETSVHFIADLGSRIVRFSGDPKVAPLSPVASRQTTDLPTAIEPRDGKGSEWFEPQSNKETNYATSLSR